MERVRVNFKDAYRWANVEYSTSYKLVGGTRKQRDRVQHLGGMMVGMKATIRGTSIFTVLSTELLSMARQGSKFARRYIADLIKDEFVASLKSDFAP